MDAFLFHQRSPLAIEQLYTAFKDYPLPKTIIPVFAATQWIAERPLYSRPLRIAWKGRSWNSMLEMLYWYGAGSMNSGIS